MVTPEALNRNVEMLQRAYDLLVMPGFTIHVSKASNKDLGIGADVMRANQGAVVSVRADDPATKTDEEKEAVYSIVAREGLKTQKRWYVGELDALDDGEDEVIDVANVSLILELVLRVHLLGRGVGPLAVMTEAVVGVLA
jgi:hypothetical protein